MAAGTTLEMITARRKTKKRLTPLFLIWPIRFMLKTKTRSRRLKLRSDS